MYRRWRCQGASSRWSWHSAFVQAVFLFLVWRCHKHYAACSAHSCRYCCRLVGFWLASGSREKDRVCGGCRDCWSGLRSLGRGQHRAKQAHSPSVRRRSCCLRCAHSRLRRVSATPCRLAGGASCSCARPSSLPLCSACSPATPLVEVCFKTHHLARPNTVVMLFTSCHAGYATFCPQRAQVL